MISNKVLEVLIHFRTAKPQMTQYFTPLGVHDDIISLQTPRGTLDQERRTAKVQETRLGLLAFAGAFSLELCRQSASHLSCFYSTFPIIPTVQACDTHTTFTPK